VVLQTRVKLRPPKHVLFANLDFRSTKRKQNNHECVFIHHFDATNFDHEDKFNIGPNRKNISQLFLSETVEAFVGKFGCALGGSLQNIWF
jgi:hypothetical protein